MSKTEDLSNMALWLWLWTQKLHPTQTFFLQEAANQNIVLRKGCLKGRELHHLVSDEHKGPSQDK